MNTDFAGKTFDLAIGEMYGLRVWRVDEYGRLRARRVTSPPWRPGVNVAICQRDTSPYSRIVHQWIQTYARGGFIADPGSPIVHTAATSPPPLPEDHPAPDERCECGFYAYTMPGKETYPDDDQIVTGAIKGTGRTLIGTKGFRCEKAEIVALVDPTQEDEPDDWAPWIHDRLRAVYPDVPLLPSRAALLEFVDLTPNVGPADEEFWTLP